jgi:phosphoribosylformylglycinamidine (FGAM) synthase PurS component
MATYPIKMLRDEQGQPFVPLISLDSVQDADGKSINDLLENKIEVTDIKAGNQIEIETDGNTITINNSAEGMKLINNTDTVVVGEGALDAAQGKVLKDSIPEVVNNLTTIDSKKALSAHQGYVLAGRVAPVGGATGQVLKKASDNDYAFEWGDAADPNAIVGDGSIMKIVELSYEEYLALEESGQLKDDTEYHINNWTESGHSNITAEQVSTINNSTVQEKLNNIDMINEGQNTRLDLAEANIDTVADTVNSISQTVSEHTTYLNSYVPCKIISTAAQSTPEGVINALASVNGNVDGTYMSIAAKMINDNIGAYIGTNPNIATGGPNFQAYVSGTHTLYTAILTNYSSAYIVLFKRINNNFYGTYIGP